MLIITSRSGSRESPSRDPAECYFRPSWARISGFSSSIASTW